MRRGLPSIKRVHARNFIQEEADARMQEVVVPYQQQGLNALGVDHHEVFLYLNKASTRMCTCREVQSQTDIGSASPIVSKPGISETQEITFNWNRPLFGEPHEAGTYEEDVQPDDYAFDETPEPHVNQLLESSPDCAICYRLGYLPGFTQYGKHRIVLTTYDVVDQYSVTIDRTAAPHVFERLHPNGWIEFEVTIPKYFKSAYYSVRNNGVQLDNQPFTQAGAFDLAFLKQNAGKKTRLRVNAEEFTHVVLVFDLGNEPIYANIAQMSKQTDWTLFNTIGNLNVILPMTIPEIPNGSSIVVPRIGIALIVTDVTYLRIASGQNLDWSVNTRVCQPQESMLKIAKGFPIF